MAENKDPKDPELSTEDTGDTASQATVGQAEPQARPASRSEDSELEKSFLEKYRKPVFAAVLLIVAGVAGAYIYQDSMAEKAEEAKVQLMGPFFQYQEDADSNALYGTSQSLGLETVADEYSGTPQARQANQLRAGIYLEQERYQDAAKAFGDVVGEGDLLDCAALNGKAVVLEEQGDFVKAAKAYAKAADIADSKELSPYFLQHAGRCYEEAGDKAKALELYQEIKKQYPKSNEGRQIEKFIARVQ